MGARLTAFVLYAYLCHEFLKQTHMLLALLSTCRTPFGAFNAIFYRSTPYVFNLHDAKVLENALDVPY